MCYLFYERLNIVITQMCGYNRHRYYLERGILYRTVAKKKLYELLEKTHRRN
jgi:hypothetical protein